MALTSPPDTLAYHAARVSCQQRDMSTVPCSLVAAAIQSYKQAGHTNDAVPELEALAFYGMNHGVALLSQQYAPLQPLAPADLKFVEAYHDCVAPMAVRAFYYLVMICTREARHLQNLSEMVPQIAEKFGADVSKFLTSISGGESGIAKAFLNTPPNAAIADYVDALRFAFYHGDWSGGFGGPAWGAVNDCLSRFVAGEFTAEMMLDTNWTLAHNNGPIFNKGEFYTMYDGPVLKRILDIQRSGQIPEAVLYDPAVRAYASPVTIERMEWLRDRFPGQIGGYVDWYVVEALGSVGKYDQDKDKQLVLYGLSPMASAAEKKALADLEAKKQAEIQAAIDYEKNNFTIMPGLVVSKVHRNAEAA